MYIHPHSVRSSSEALSKGYRGGFGRGWSSLRLPRGSKLLFKLRGCSLSKRFRVFVPIRFDADRHFFFSFGLVAAEALPPNISPIFAPREDKAPLPDGEVEGALPPAAW